MGIRKIHVKDLGFGWQFFENDKEIELENILADAILDKLDEILEKEYGYTGFADDVVSSFDAYIDDNGEISIDNIVFVCDEDDFDSREIPWKDDTNCGKLTVDLEEIETIYVQSVTQITCHSFRIDGVGISGKRYEISVLTKEKLIDPYVEDVLKAEWQEVRVDEV